MKDLTRELKKLTLTNDTLQKQLIRSFQDILSIVNTLYTTEARQHPQLVVENQETIVGYTQKDPWENEVLITLIHTYQNKSFDDLIRTSTKQSVRRDKQLIGQNEEITPILTDLETYFDAHELLTQKYNPTDIKNAQDQLRPLSQSSQLLDQLRENIRYYKDFSDKLKKTVEKLVRLDEEKAAARIEEIQEMKLNEILYELSNYMYNYYDYTNYPYLSEIISQIIKRKYPNADANIKDLLEKLS